jgi:hypothetical protein
MFLRESRIGNAVLIAASLCLAVVILGIMACLPVPVGDPETSKVDAKLTGAWLLPPEAGDSREAQLYLVAPFDARTYLVRIFGYKEADGKIEPSMTGIYKAWLTKLGGQTFVTLDPQMIETSLGWTDPAAGSKNEIRYFVGKVTAADTSIEVAIVNGAKGEDKSLFKDVKTRADAEAVISAHVNDAAIYTDKPLKFQKIDREKAKPILDAFHAE